jgi:hypothetical protein
MRSISDGSIPDFVYELPQVRSSPQCRKISFKVPASVYRKSMQPLTLPLKTHLAF